MSKWRTICLVLAMITLTLGGNQALARAPQPARDQPGVFDYYVLSLSWSPEHCASSSGSPDQQQCHVGRRYGFVVHGLWPQYERGYPASCQGNPRVAEQLMQRLLPIMPSAQLIQHEWRKHGTCSGLTAQQYFEKVEDAYALVTIPSRYRNPADALRLAPRQLKHDFVAVNPHFTPETFAITCRGRFLREVRVCLDKDLKPRSCGTDVRDGCHPETIILRPVR